MSSVKKEEALSYIDNARFSNVAKSCRRIYFNHLHESIYERGHFHVDQMYGLGSGILIYYDERFFLLTAKHVLDTNLHGDFQNESPLWITVNYQGEWESLNDFLMPKIIWNIGELIEKNNETIDVCDVSLIELFPPPPFQNPDHFIEICDKNSVLIKKEFFEGQFLLVSGYPLEKNDFCFDITSDKYTHSTKLTRHTTTGVFIEEDDIGYISFEILDDVVSSGDMNGMSGGVVYNVQPNTNQVKLAGMAVTAGNNMCRFIPSYLFIDAILNYRKASYEIVDPIALCPKNPKDMFKYLLDYIENSEKQKINRATSPYQCRPSSDPWTPLF